MFCDVTVKMECKKKIKIIAVGDICPGDHYFTIGHGTGSMLNKIDTEMFDEAVTSLLQTGDLLFGNLECPLSDNSINTSLIEKNVFRGHPRFASCLAKLGFDVINLANNHICQHGAGAFKKTVDSLEEEGVSVLGITGGKEFASQPVVYTVKGVSIGFLGYSLVPEKYLPTSELYARPPFKTIISDVQKLSDKTDIVIVSIHQGDEGLPAPSPSVIETSRKVIDAGAKIVLNHHTHVFQPVEYYEKGLIFYSLGDFMFDLFWDPALVLSAVAAISIDLENFNLSYSLYPTKMTREYKIVPIAGEELSSFYKNLYYVENILCKEKEIYKNYFNSKFTKVNSNMIYKKILFFLFNYLHGNSMQKTKFLLKKLAALFRLEPKPS